LHYNSYIVDFTVDGFKNGVTGGTTKGSKLLPFVFIPLPKTSGSFLNPQTSFALLPNCGKAY
jgi:hypothetical protein